MGLPECHKTNYFNTTQLLLQSNFECFEGTPKSKTHHMNTYTSTFIFPNHSLIISRWLNSVVLASCTLRQFNVALEHSIFYEANEHINHLLLWAIYIHLYHRYVSTNQIWYHLIFGRFIEKLPYWASPAAFAAACRASSFLSGLTPSLIMGISPFLNDSISLGCTVFDLFDFPF